MSQKAEAARFELVALTLLDESSDPVGAARLAAAWHRVGLPGAEATAGRFLRRLDQRGLTYIHRSTKGRLLTEQGRERLLHLRQRHRLDQRGAELAKAINVTESSDLIDLLVVRRSVETEACRLAATRASDQEIAQLVLVASAQVNAVSDGHETTAPSMNFHRLIAEASHNRMLIAVALLLLDPTNDPLERMLADIANESGATLDQARDHVMLADALQRRNAQGAEQAMRRHMDKLIESVDVYRNVHELPPDRPSTLTPGAAAEESVEFH